MIRRPARLAGAQRAERDTDHERENERHSDELERRGKAVDDVGPDGLFRVVQLAVAAAERTLGPLGLTDPRVLTDPEPVAILPQ